MRLVRPVVLACLLACVVPASVQAAAYAPAGRGVFHAGLGGYGPGAVDEFARQSGKHPAVYQYFVDWSDGRRDLRWVKGLFDNTDRARSRVMLHIGPNARVKLSPAAIAAGRGDGFLLALNRIVADHGKPTYIRLMSEMNNGENPYAAYDVRGRSRGRSYSTAAFKRAWRRTFLILRGGTVAEIDRRLRRLRLPPVRTAAAELPRPQVAFQWVPLTFGNPEIARNHPRRWWPGARYVDWVGTTFYSKHGYFPAVERFYNMRPWRRKPFVFGEYGVWGREDPRFVRRLLSWSLKHRRVKLICYYQSSMLKREFRLSSHPRSRQALRRGIRSRRFVAYAPEHR